LQTTTSASTPIAPSGWRLSLANGLGPTEFGSYDIRTCSATADTCKLTFVEQGEGATKEMHCEIPKGLQLCNPSLDRAALRERCEAIAECNSLDEKVCEADDACDWVVP
jgi:hypothetical protein